MKLSTFKRIKVYQLPGIAGRCGFYGMTVLGVQFIVYISPVTRKPKTIAGLANGARSCINVYRKTAAPVFKDGQTTRDYCLENRLNKIIYCTYEELYNNPLPYINEKKAKELLSTL